MRDVNLVFSPFSKVILFMYDVSTVLFIFVFRTPVLIKLKMSFDLYSIIGKDLTRNPLKSGVARIFGAR